MYYYIYDTFLSDKKYEKVLDKIKTTLLDLEIQGKHEKLTLLKSIDELIRDEVKRGAKTIVILGNDKTFLKVVDVIAKKDVTLGLVPIGPDNQIAKCLGLPEAEAACEILAARKVIKFDLGKINDSYFFLKLKVDKNLSRLSVQKDNFKIIPKPSCVGLEVANFCLPSARGKIEKKLKKSSAQDGLLELIVKVKPDKRSWLKKDEAVEIDTVIQGTEFEIKSFEYLPLLLDEYKVMKTPVIVKIVPQKLKVIVGKDRLKNIN